MKAKKVLTPEEKAELIRHSRHRHLATDLVLIFCTALFVALFCYLESHLPTVGIHTKHISISARQLINGIHCGTGIAGLSFGGTVAKSYCYHLHAIRKTRTPNTKEPKIKLPKDAKRLQKLSAKLKKLEIIKTKHERLVHKLKESTV